MNPSFTERSVPALDEALVRLLPEQGSFELQHDQPAKVHNWHRHSLDEELFVVAGDVVLFWDDGGTCREQHCPAGTWITLPAGTVHGSIAGRDGATYMIRPEGGASAQTEFLAADQFPHPTPSGIGRVA